MRLIAAGETLSSAPAAAKLPLRAAASKALMPLRKSSRLTAASRKLMLGQDNSVCANSTSEAQQDAGGDSHGTLDDRGARRADGGDRLPVGPVRHGRRADPD